MSYYSDPKHKFSTVVASLDKKSVEYCFLQCMCEKWYDTYNLEKGYLEQWLYNTNEKEIYTHFLYFAKGFFFGKLRYPDVDIILSYRKLITGLLPVIKDAFPELLKLYTNHQTT